MMERWKNIAWLGLLVLVGCSSKAITWLEQPTGVEQRIQEIREERTEYEPIVPSNTEQRLKWRDERSKEFHKMRQFYNPEYEDYRMECVVGDTLTLYLKQEKQIKREKVNRPNKRRSR